jgi:hypothetical protein
LGKYRMRNGKVKGGEPFFPENPLAFFAEIL